MQDLEKHCQRRGVGRAVVRCSERQWSQLSASDEQVGRENVQALGQIHTDVYEDALECYLYQGWALLGSAY